ncbi:MAG: DUF3683 domain-containing protein [Mariprofundales bacterium]
MPHREIPYNYTSCSDREIILRFLGEDAWQAFERLHTKRKTGRSARRLFQILGDLWVIARNPYLQEDMARQSKRRDAVRTLHKDRISRIEKAVQAQHRDDLSLILTKLQEYLLKFERELIGLKRKRQDVQALFAHHTHKHNINFTPFARITHATDATDWRQEVPFCVLTPDSPAEISGLIIACQQLGMTLIPRGGGTGLCGAAVPLHVDSVMLNTEKLDAIGSPQQLEHNNRNIHTITAQCGAVTGQVMQAAKPYVFATDPTSLWACSIGGNIATNAGGKHAVLWGTCVDNLLSWKMVLASGEWLYIERMQHNMGRIPIDEDILFRIQRFESDGITKVSKEEDETLVIHGSVFRREGLGKDVTRKALGGLPAVQKEGTDGLVTEATFVIHEPYNAMRTVCCEFFGHELAAATRAMVEIKEYVDACDGACFEGLEHFDEKYVKAINYISKSARSERPRVVLLMDISGNDALAVAKAAAGVCRLTSEGNGEGFTAISAEERVRFWADRGRMSAIAKHTRAFKINEDVVIPLHRLSEYNDFIEYLNITASISNKCAIAKALDEWLFSISTNNKINIDSIDNDNNNNTVEAGETLAHRIQRARIVVQNVHKDWQQMLAGLDTMNNYFRQIQCGTIRISYHKSLEKPLFNLLLGHDDLQQQITAIHKRVLSARIVVATHMHAGDGNVHTNIPVNSNDMDMMHEAHKTVELVMQKAVELGGVISGEHGIGITKLPFLNPDWLAEMQEYRQKIDPQSLFNRGKLDANTKLDLTYTPSFNLLEMEATLMEAADLTELADVISPCLRCGKCKPVCNTHFPRSNMLYAPRNKILATAAIIEAFLYESQTSGGISFNQFAGLNDVASHCTICHKCVTPCPVNIDFGEVTEKMRALLRNKGQAHRNIGTWASLNFLTLRQPQGLELIRDYLMRPAYAIHQYLHKLATRIDLVQNKTAVERNLEGVPAQIISFVERPLPSLQAGTLRKLLTLSKHNNNIPILRKKDADKERAVLYFPGCGSERLFPEIGLASLAALFDLGINIVLPPEYLCCGYPSTASGDAAKGKQISYDNRVLLHRMQHALSYLTFEAVIVSCGTCFDQLELYELGKIFPSAPLIDVHEYLMQQGVSVQNNGATYVYHEPCHTPMKQYGSQQAILKLLQTDAMAVPECCGEAGTLAVSSPEIAARIRTRKEEEISKINANAANKASKILTSCPSCLQGLSRLENQSDMQADYIVIELMKQRFGEQWQQLFLEKVHKGGIEHVLM